MGFPEVGDSSFEETLKVRPTGLLQERLASMGALRLPAKTEEGVPRGVMGSLTPLWSQLMLSCALARPFN